MIEWLESIDRAIVLTVNGLNTPFLDELMWFISGKFTWIPLYLLLLYLAGKKLGWKKTLLFLTCIILVIGSTDFVCSGIIKDSVQRYRPSHNLLLTNQLHFYSKGPDFVYKGGMYGFVSSHAGNFFALAVFAGLILKPFFRNSLKALLCIAVLVSFSRIYLGVHYLSDIIGGAAIGILMAMLMYRYVYTPLSNRVE